MTAVEPGGPQPDTGDRGPGDIDPPGPSDPYDPRLVLGAAGLLRDFNRAGVLVAADVHVAQRLGRLGGESDERVLLAAALAVRGVRHGSVCVVLPLARATVAADGAADDDPSTRVQTLAWPDPAEWLAACAASPLVAVGVGDGGGGGPGQPLRLVDDLVYLDRYWRQEQLVRHELDRRAASPVAPVDPTTLATALARLFPDAAPDRQRLAAAMTALRSVTVLAGGPGTGKTRIVARLLDLLRSLPGRPPRVALAAPTGKAAARLQEAVTEAAAGGTVDVGTVEAVTLHRLLGSRPDSRSRFRHDRHNRLPYDVIVVDETSMVSLSLMASLLDAVRPDARIVLVGDPDQLASVEAGAVLGDLVLRPADSCAVVPDQLAGLVGADLSEGELGSDLLRNGVVRLTRGYRYGEAIGRLAAAVQAVDPDTVLATLRSPDQHAELVETDPSDERSTTALGGLRADVVSAAGDLTAAARTGDVTRALQLLERHRLLCAHRHGPYGVSRWTRQIERWLADAGSADEGEWYLGRPLLVTANDYDLRLFNGDTGVVVAGERGPVAAFGRGADPVTVAPSRLAAVQTVHAMTVHRAQGSQFDRVSLLLPPAESPLLTRELFYTGVTRAIDHVRVIGSEQAVRVAVSRPIMRASGLRRSP